MTKSKIITYVILGVIVLFCIFGGFGACSTYNKLATAEQNVNQSWADVEAQYQRRLDMIPNLVATVKGYAKHERGTLTEVTAMRAGAAVEQAGNELINAAEEAQATPNGPNANARTANPAVYSNLDRAYGLYINAVHEAYPQLMANENFLDLQKQIEGTENRITTARNRYNEQVRDYNVMVVRFPAKIFAGMFGFAEKQMFAADPGASKAPVVSFDDAE